MDFAPDEDHEQIVEAVDRVCAVFDDNYWSACDTDHRFPTEFYDAMAKGGWIGIVIPEEYGGGGRGITEAALVLNRIAASGAGMNGSSSIHLTMFGLNPVVKFGNDRLKQTFLPRAAAGDLHVAFGVTEPDAGTDTSRITTRATDDGMGGWIVNGRKIWTSKALESEVVLLLVRTDHDASNRFGGLTLFLADLDPDYVDISPIPKLGRNAVASCEVVYDDLPVEGWRMVGERGRGFQHLLHGLNPERILLAATGAGSVRWRSAAPSPTPRNGSCSIGRSAPTRRSPTRSPRPTWSSAGARLMQLAAWRYDHDLECGEAANTAKYLAAKPASSPPTRHCRPMVGSATRWSTTSSATGARPACSGWLPSARR